jgi:hypothetical protein
MSDSNIKISIESEGHYWNDLLYGLEILLRNPNLSSDVRSAVSHFKVKLNNALTVSGHDHLD